MFVIDDEDVDDVVNDFGCIDLAKKDDDPSYNVNYFNNFNKRRIILDEGDESNSSGETSIDDFGCIDVSIDDNMMMMMMNLLIQ
jgi:hypothetical protein